MNRKFTVGIIGTVAAAGIATNVLVDPEDLVRTAEALEDRTRIETDGGTGDYAVSYAENGKLTGTDAVRDWIIRLPLAVKAVILLPLWALGAIPVAIGTGIASALAPVWGQIAGFFMQTAVLLAVFCAVYKLLFPQMPIRELVKRKNLTWLVLGAGGVVGANLVLSEVWTQWTAWRAVLLAAAGFGILCLLWHRICRKLPGPKAAPKVTRLELSYD